MEKFDVSEIIESYEKELAKQDPKKLKAKLDQDPEKGLAQLEEILTFLPEEQRKAKIKGFVNAMLND